MIKRKDREDSDDESSYRLHRISYYREPPDLTATDTVNSRAIDVYSCNQFTDSLKQIRLLRVHAGTENAELEANFILSEGAAVPYEALSYTWGNPSLDSTLRILSHGDAYSIPITQNLASALRHLRLRNTARILWVDALCINQEDNDEKNAQIPRMAEIYRSATNVCIWLGEEAQGSERAMKFVKQVLNLEYFDRLVSDPRHSAEWAALSALMRRSWFSRRWVIQEVTFARDATLYCGKDWVKWKDFAHVVALVGVRHHTIRQLFVESTLSSERGEIGHLTNITALAASRLVHASRNLFHQSDDGGMLKPILSLESLVYSLSPFESSRPHDTIYAILPLAEDIRYIGTRSYDPHDVTAVAANSTSSSNFAPDDWLENDKLNSQARFVLQKLRSLVKENTYPVDYNKSYFEVCKDFIQFSVRRSSSLDILCRPWAPDDEDLPSWVAQSSAAAFRSGMNRADSRVRGDPLVGAPGGPRIYNADGRKEVRFMIGKSLSVDGLHHEKSLFVHGFIVDEIESKVLPAQQGNIPSSWPEFGGWHDTSSLPPDSFWRTLVADRGPDRLIPPSYYQLACHHAFEQRIAGGDLVIKELVETGMPSIVYEFLSRLQAVVFQRRLIRTRERRLLGLAPEGAKKGDLVCVLFGLSVPILLRKVKHDSPGSACHYRMVGECYIHGIMNGEARVLKGDKIAFRKMEFEIR